MSAPRGRGLRPGGVVRALGRLVLLIALGFGAGLVIGVVSEEPELLAGHLRGESTSVMLRDDEFGHEMSATERENTRPAADSSDSSNAGDVRALAVEAPADREGDFSGVPKPTLGLGSRGRPEPDRDRSGSDPLPRVAAAPAPSVRVAPSVTREATPRPDATPPPIGSPQAYAIQVGAFSEERAAKGLAGGLEAKGYPVDVLPANRNTRRWRVRVQPVAGDAAAQAMADRLKRDEGLPTWVIPLDPGSPESRAIRSARDGRAGS